MSNIENNIGKVNPNPSGHRRASNQPNNHSNPVKNIDSIDINMNMSKPALALTDTGTGSGSNTDALKMLDDTISQLEKGRDDFKKTINNIELTDEEKEYYSNKYPHLDFTVFDGVKTPTNINNESLTASQFHVGAMEKGNNISEYKDEYDAFLEEYLHISGGYYETLDNYNQDILMLRSTRYSLAQQAKEQPYIDLQQTDDYIEYINNLGDVDSRIKAIDQENKKDNKVGYYGSGFNNSTIPQLEYMTPEDKGVYCYLFDTKGREAADQYLEAITDKLNKAEGFAEATEFLESVAKRDGNGNVITDKDGKIVIDENLLTDAKVGFKGFFDGAANFGEGLENAFSSDGIMSANQYAQSYLLEALYNCGDDSILPDLYNFNFSFGNLAPPLVATILVSTIYPPAGATLFTLGSTEVTAAGIFGYSLMGLSIYGNAKNNALISGTTRNMAYLYGLCNALSEIGLGVLLGGLPILNGTSKYVILDLLKEGTEEFIQEYVSAGWDSIFLKQPTDLATLDENARKSFLYGMLMSGMLNGVKTTVVKLGNQEVQLSIQKITEYLNEHKGATFVEAIEKTSNVKFFEPSAAAPVDNGVNNPNNGFYQAGDLTNPNPWFRPGGDLNNSTPGINGSPIKAMSADDIVNRINLSSGNLATVDFSYLSNLSCETLYTVFDSISDYALAEMLKNKTVIAACDTVIRNTDSSDALIGYFLRVLTGYTPSGRLYANGTTQTGVNQGTIREVFETNDVALQDKLVKQVQQQYSRMSREEATNFLKTIEAKDGSKGICNYADVANIIFEHFSRMANPEQAFENTFGFPMYWNGELNDAQLITDMMLKISGDSLIFKNHGLAWFKSKFQSAENNNNYLNLNHGVEEIYTYKFEIINEYLSNYGLILTPGIPGISTTIFSNFDIKDFNGPVDNFSAYTDVALTNLLKSYLNGNSYIYSYSAVDTQIVLDNQTKLDIKEGSLIKITGYNATNDSVNILYNGRPYTIKVSDLKNSTLRVANVYTHNPGDTQVAIQQIGLGLLNGKHVSISAMPGLKMVEKSTGNTRILPEAHVMTVIGVDSNNRIIVDSWGETYYIDISDAANSGNFFKIDITEINDVVP